MLGRCYMDGTGVAQDQKKAFELFQKATADGHAAAAYNLGDCYFNGLGTDLKDYQSSKLIALLGVTDAQLTEFSVDMSVRDIKKKVKDIHGESGKSDASYCDAPGGDSSGDDTYNGKEIIDGNFAEVNSQTLVTFHNIDEYNKYLDGLNDLIEKALKSKNFEADHKRIEIVVKS